MGPTAVASCARPIVHLTGLAVWSQSFNLLEGLALSADPDLFAFWDSTRSSPRYLGTEDCGSGTGPGPIRNMIPSSLRIEFIPENGTHMTEQSYARDRPRPTECGVARTGWERRCVICRPPTAPELETFSILQQLLLSRSSSLIPPESDHNCTWLRASRLRALSGRGAGRRRGPQVLRRRWGMVCSRFKRVYRQAQTILCSSLRLWVR